MENNGEYTPVSDVDTDEGATSDYTDMSEVGKKKGKVNKRKPVTKPVSHTKKQKLEKNTPYMSKIRAILETENVDEECVNSLSVKQNNHTFTLKYPMTNGEDFWILQHFKMKDIKDVAPMERWKHSMTSIRMQTSNKKSKDANIVKQLNKAIELISDRFADDSGKKITKRKIDYN